MWLLAHMLDWHRREEKAPWWEYFRLRELSDEELLDETPALAGLEHVERLPAAGRTPVDRYRFPPQETKIREGDKLHVPLPDGRKFGDVEAIDLVARTVDIKKRGSHADVHPTSVFAHDSVRADEQAESLMRLGEWVADARRGRVRALTAPPAICCSGGAPRLAAHVGRRIAGAGRGRRHGGRGGCALELDHGTLAIQGPPGSGKTFTGARMICDLVRAGKARRRLRREPQGDRNLLEPGR